MSSDGLLILKPDILDGPFAVCRRAAARDTVRGILAAYGAPATAFELAESEGAVAWGLRNIRRKVDARGWYTLDLRDRAERLRALERLLQSESFTGEGSLSTAQLAVDIARALGFHEKTRHAWRFSQRDFLGLYAKNTHFTRLCGELRRYLVGQTLEVLLLQGEQELSTLHIAKELLRRVVRYPTSHYDAVENLLHVADPGATDWQYFDKVLAGRATPAAEHAAAAPSQAAATSAEAPFVSVCIPVRNGEAQLPHTLTNLLRRSTYPADRFEIVIGDHASTDGTPALIAAFQREFSNVVNVLVPFGSPNRASVRNALIQRAKGEILVFLDHDTLACDDFLSKHVAAHRQFPSALVAGETFGKGVFKREIEEHVATLKLDHISESRASLCTNPELADFRTRPDFIANEGDANVVVTAPAPFRFFWTCNLSARRADVIACGSFDEAYDGWGLEDDDLAQRLRAAGNTLVFSRAAWAFHLPHPADHFAQLASWRRNYEVFFRKFPTREAELYSLYGHELATAGRRLQGVLATLAKLDSAVSVAELSALLGKPTGRRACHFVREPSAARALGLTDALNPFGPLTDAPRQTEGVAWWPLVGFKTPFAEREIDETIVLVEVLMRVDRYVSCLLLSEAARVSRRVIFYSSAECLAAANRHALRALHDVAKTVHFAEATWLEAGSIC